MAGLVPPAGAESLSEKNGFKLGAPPLSVKRTFWVTEKDRELIEQINDASDSISSFVLELFGLSLGRERATLFHVVPALRETLRLPPLVEGSDKTRYVASAVYGWKQSEPDQLECSIEWSDPGRPHRRYSDSYVFVKLGTEWLFKGNGSAPPQTWVETNPQRGRPFKPRALL